MTSAPVLPIQIGLSILGEVRAELTGSRRGTLSRIEYGKLKRKSRGIRLFD